MRAVVLAGDYAYIRQIETTLKSLIYHHAHIKVYVFNQDIPKEWFIHIRGKLRRMGSELVDVKLLDTGVDFHWSLGEALNHINHMTFARYFIPRYVAEDTVLYLDSDLVLTTAIDELFDLDIEDYYLAASRSAFEFGVGFNAGVMLINNKRWKAEQMFERLVEQTIQEHDKVAEGDQTILNTLMGHQYLLLPDDYNYQIGFDLGAHLDGHQYHFQKNLEPLPAVLHYLSMDKPWRTFSSGRLREIWWDYAFLEWGTIEKKWSSLHVELAERQVKGHLFVLTNTHELKAIEDLILGLPDYQFHIGAYTNMSDSLTKLNAYEHVHLYPFIIEDRIGRLLE